MIQSSGCKTVQAYRQNTSAPPFPSFTAAVAPSAANRERGSSKGALSPSLR